MVPVSAIDFFMANVRSKILNLLLWYILMFCSCTVTLEKQEKFHNPWAVLEIGMLILFPSFLWQMVWVTYVGIIHLLIIWFFMQFRATSEITHPQWRDTLLGVQECRRKLCVQKGRQNPQSSSWRKGGPCVKWAAYSYAPRPKDLQTWRPCAVANHAQWGCY